MSRTKLLSTIHTQGDTGPGPGEGTRSKGRRLWSTRPPASTYTRLLFLFVLAVCIRVLYIYSTAPEAPIGSTDAWGYHRLALNLDRGNGFSLRRRAPFVPDSVRTPLYPAVLLLIRRTLGPSPRAAVLVQAILDGCTAVCAYGLAAETTRALGSASSTRRRTGYLAALLYALNAAQVRSANELLTETTLSWLLTCCLYTLVRTIRLGTRRLPDTPIKRGALQALALGVLAGFAALCKPNVQFLPLIWIPCILLAGRRPHLEDEGVASGGSRPRRVPGLGAPNWRNAGLATLGFLVVVTPWLIRNALVFGRPFLSTAFEGNVSRVSAPAAAITARGQYAIPWSAEWEAAFGEIVSQAATRYGWDRPWETLSARELDRANRQVYRIAREHLRQHPLAWLESHFLGTLRYLEPRIYRVLHFRFAGRPWPSDVLEDSVIHTIRAVARGRWSEAIEIVSHERWSKLDPLQRTLWWGTFLAQIVSLACVVRGTKRLARCPALAVALTGTIAYILLLPGPIAYERFRVPILSPILVTIAVAGTL